MDQLLSKKLGLWLERVKRIAGAANENTVLTRPFLFTLWSYLRPNFQAYQQSIFLLRAYHLLQAPKLASLISPLAAHSLGYLYLRTQGQYWLYLGIADNQPLLILLPKCP